MIGQHIIYPEHKINLSLNSIYWPSGTILYVYRVLSVYKCSQTNVNKQIVNVYNYVLNLFDYVVECELVDNEWLEKWTISSSHVIIVFRNFLLLTNCHLVLQLVSRLQIKMALFFYSSLFHALLEELRAYLDMFVNYECNTFVYKPLVLWDYWQLEPFFGHFGLPRNGHNESL